MDTKPRAAAVVLPSVIAFTSKPTSSFGSQRPLFHLKNSLKVERARCFCVCWDRAGKEMSRWGQGRRDGCGAPIQLSLSLSQTLAGSPPPASACSSGLAFSGGAFVSRCSHCLLQPHRKDSYSAFPTLCIACPGCGWGSRWSLIALVLGDLRPGCRLPRTEVKCFPFLLAVNEAGWEN